MERMDLTWYFMSIAQQVAKRSTCIRRQVGAIAVRDNRILSTGYNGAPRSFSHCTKESCIRHKENIPSGEQLDRCIAVHAEQNVILQAAIHGVSLAGCDIYCTTSPCITCWKMLMNIPELGKIYVLDDYVGSPCRKNMTYTVIHDRITAFDTCVDKRAFQF